MGREIWRGTKIKITKRNSKRRNVKKKEQLKRAIEEEQDKSIQDELISRLDAFKVDERKKN